MGRSGDTPGLPLSARPVGGTPGPDQPRACWVLLPTGTVTGTVHAWRRDPSGGWQALVVAWLPTDALAPRDTG